MITGLSGSGNSSLAVDTLYAEGQRRYLESLSAYARQFLQLMASERLARSGLMRNISLGPQAPGPGDGALAQKSYMHLQKVLDRCLLEHPTLAAVTARDPGATAFDERLLDKMVGDVQKMPFPGRAPSLHHAPGSTAVLSEQQTDEPFVADMSEQQTDAPFVAALSLPPKTGSTSSSSK